MIHETILAIIIAFAISALLCPIIIPFLETDYIYISCRYDEYSCL